MTEGNKSRLPKKIVAVMAFVLLIPALIIIHNKYTQRQNTIESHQPSVSQHEKKKRHHHAKLRKQHNPGAAQVAQKTDDDRRAEPDEETVKTTESVTETNGHSTGQEHTQPPQPEAKGYIRDHAPTISIVRESEKWARDNATGSLNNSVYTTRQASATQIYNNINVPVQTPQIKPVIWFGDPKKRNTNNYE